MADGYTTSGLIAKVRRAGMLPTYAEGADDMLLAFLNDAQLTYVAQQLERTREEYRTTTLDITLSPGVLSYPIPTRAIAAGLKMLQVVDAAGSVWGLWEMRPQDWPASGGVWVSPCRRWYLQGNNIRFYAEPPAGTLRVTYPLRMSELVLPTDTTNVRTISTINTGTKTLTLSGTFTNASGLCDLVKATPHFDILSMDATFTGTGTATLVFADTLPTLAVGDYVCSPDKSPVCQAPLELHSLLALHVAFVALQAKGDAKASSLAQLRDDTAARVLMLLEPRPSRVRSVINYSAPGFRNWRGGRQG